LTDQEEVDQPPLPPSTPAPKAKAKMQTKGQKATSSKENVETDEADFELLEAQHPETQESQALLQVEAMQYRMQALEQMMGQILGHLQNQSSTPP
jgi:hypothetical protein